MRVAVVGVGLIGGSIGLAARARAAASVAGFDPRDGVLEQRAGSAGRWTASRGSVDEAVAEAEMVFVAAPVGALGPAVDAALTAAGPDCAVSDVGSTKRAVLAGRDDPRFMGGHPLAGAETAGVAHARADLFDGATWYLTPTDTTSGVLYERLHRLVASLGAQPAAIDAAAHDRLMACVSHLPHVLANVLVAQAAAAVAGGGRALPATGPSFRDATRVAGASGAIWTEIYLSNADALIDRIDDTVARLSQVRASLSAADARGGRAVERRGGRPPPAAAGAPAGRRAGARAACLGAQPARGDRPHRPGAGSGGHQHRRHGALPRRRTCATGVVALWVAGDSEAQRAQDLVGALGFPVARA